MLELRGITKYYNPGTVNEMCLFQNFQPDRPERRVRLCRRQQWIRQNVHAEYSLWEYPGGFRQDFDGWEDIPPE